MTDSPAQNSPRNAKLDGLKPKPAPIVKWIIRNFGRLFWGLSYSGKENLPKHGPFIVAPNHMSYIDPFIANSGMKVPLFFMAQANLFKNPIFRFVLRWCAVFPVDLERDDIAALRAALAVLRSGGGIMIFPEGERSRDGHLKELKRGVIRLALQTHAPILPVRIEGASRAWGRGRKPRPTRGLSVQYLPLIDVRAITHQPIPRADQEELLTTTLREKLINARP